MKTPPTSGIKSAAVSAISLAGVIGYPKNALQPAKIAPLTTASFPFISCLGILQNFLFCFLFDRCFISGFK